VVTAVGCLPGVGLYYLLVTRAPTAAQFIGQLALSGSTLLLALLAAWAAGPTRWTELRQFVKLPRLLYAAMGFIPIAVEAVFIFGLYFRDRIAWVNTEFGQSVAPILRSYVRPLEMLRFVEYLPAAFFEEIIYRGYLQPRFARRFGVWRGLFLLGTAWGAYHFFYDFSFYYTDAHVFRQLVLRLGVCVTLGFVLGWLTLRSGSILPAALFHGFNNVFLTWPVEHSSPSQTVFLILFSGVFAFVLFRYWPPVAASESSEEQSIPAAEPAL
jgi:membrane protease YdiL (CAAX protease family)